MQWDDDKFVGFDFETDGVDRKFALQPWRMRQPKHDGELELPFHVSPYRAFAENRAWPTSVSFVRKLSNPDRFDKLGTTYPDPSAIYLLLKQAVDEGRTIVGWNILFDIQWLLAICKPRLRDLVFKAKWLDGMLLWKHYFIEPEYEMDRSKKKSYSLKEAVREMLPDYAGYEDEIVYHNPTPEELDALHKYNHRDVIFTLKFTRYFYNKLALEPQRLKAALIEAQCLPFVAEANLEGMPIDYLTCKELMANSDRIAAKNLAKLSPHGVSEKVVRSPKQLSKLMFEDWQLPILKKNTSKKTGNETNSTDKEVLHELSFIDWRAKALREYREALGDKTKFAETPLEAMEYNEDGVARPQAIVFGTYTSRMTYASKQGKNKDAVQIGFALHQMKRDKKYRETVNAPEGYEIVEFDASGQEYRWMACASGDKVMLRLCEPGEDPHSYMGANIGQRDYQDVIKANAAKEEWAAGPHGIRNMGKLANLSLQYRTSAPKLRVKARVDYNIPMEMPEARRIWRTYQLVYPGVPTYWDNQIRIVRQLGYAETFAGRRVQVTGDWNGDFGWSMGSTAINYKIQGTGGDQKYLAMAVLKNILLEYDVRFAWDLHDGLYYFVPKPKVELFQVRAKKLLDNLPYQKAWGYTPPIPMPWDTKRGASWGTLKETK